MVKDFEFIDDFDHIESKKSNDKETNNGSEQFHDNEMFMNEYHDDDLNAIGQASMMSNIAEAGSLQLEFRYLAKMTGNTEYEDLVMKIFNYIVEEQPESGLFPVNIM